MSSDWQHHFERALNRLNLWFEFFWMLPFWNAFKHIRSSEKFVMFWKRYELFERCCHTMRLCRFGENGPVWKNGNITWFYVKKRFTLVWYCHIHHTLLHHAAAIGMIGTIGMKERTHAFINEGSHIVRFCSSVFISQIYMYCICIYQKLLNIAIL